MPGDGEEDEPDAWFYLRTSVSPQAAKDAGCTVSPEDKSKHAPNAEVPLKPKGSNGWTFTGWTGENGDEDEDSETPHYIVMNGSKKVTANFVQKFTLTATTAGKGTVTTNPVGPEHTAGSTVVSVR